MPWKPLLQNGGRRLDDPLADGRIIEIHTGILARLYDVAEPGLHADGGSCGMHRIDQPACLRRNHCQRQRAVVLQRTGVDVEVADAGALQSLRQGGHVRGGFPAVDPGVTEPDRVLVAGPGRRVAGVLHAQ